MNPYSPPSATSASPPTPAPAASAWRDPLVMLVIGVAIGHLLCAVAAFPSYASLFSSGTVGVPTLLFSLIACGLFYGAVFQLPGAPRRAKILFACAAVVMGTAATGWGLRDYFAANFLAGGLASLAACWLAHRRHLAATR